MDHQTGKEEMAVVRSAIAAANLKKCEVAAYMGCHESTMSKYLTERREPPPGFVAEALNAVEELALEERERRERRKQRYLERRQPPG